MDIGQSEKQCARFTSDFVDWNISVSDFMDFCGDFSELMKNKKVSQGSINFFSNVLALFLWSDNYLDDYDKVKFLIEKYLEAMEAQ